LPVYRIAAASPAFPSRFRGTNAYAVAVPLTGGDLGQAAGTGPPTETLDFSTFKDFALTERFKL
jgi:hypothetical protein